MDLEEEETEGVMDLPQNANLGRSMEVYGLELEKKSEVLLQ